MLPLTVALLLAAAVVVALAGVAVGALVTCRRRDLRPARPVDSREISIHVVAETAAATASLERLMSQARAVAEAATLARRAVDALAAAELRRDLGDPPEAMQ